MGSTQLRKSQFLRYNFLRNLYNFILYSSLVLLGVFVLIAYFILDNNNPFQPIVFYGVIIYVIAFIFFRPHSLRINMYYHYFKMLVQNLPPFKVQRFPFDPKFDSFLVSQGYRLAMKVQDFTIFYLFNKNLTYTRRTTPTLIWIIKIHNQSFHTNDERIEKQVEIIKQNFLKNLFYYNELTLIFKLVDFLTNNMLDSFQEVVNYSIHNRTLITLPCAAIRHNKCVYTLRPKRAYPNKYYYALIQTLFLITDAKGLTR